ncbi:MAG: CRTAC1 family protein [Acidobacteriia bacterium]|nr:CRTAC1 family protein [Terriglobia bacterium]MYG01994.1 CRTAC1 family protein [Terriglobia bacterium]MYK08645.1 CRTAC1 family protein [Terriglobia bacterium]
MLPSKGASLLVPVALLCQAASVPAQIRFRPATEDSGVGFTLRHAPTERKRMVETMAGGLAVFDFDEDAEIGTVGAHRGAAVADFDADGRLDAVASALGEPAQLFRNVSEPSHAWLALQLIGERSGRDALGARVRVEGQTRWVKSAAGYPSSALRPVHFGLGDSDQPIAVEIDWPGVRVRRFVRPCS